jgi:signal transduction histidine kinase
VTRSLVTRLTWLEQLTVIGAVAAFGLLSLWVTSKVLTREREAFVATTARRLAASFEEDLHEEPDTLTVAQGLIEDGREVGVRVEVRDSRGRLLASSFHVPTPDGDGADGKGGARSGFTARARNSLGARIDVRLTDRALRESLSALQRSLLIAALPIVAISLLVGRTIVTRALRPLSTMAERAAGLAVEHKPRSLGERSGLIEVDRLAASFDRLLERLDDAMSSERRLTADASHELRTPLTVMSGELEMLAERTPPDSPAAEFVRRCTQQVGAMRELVEAILLLHRSGEAGANQSSGFELLNLSDMARETLAEVAPQYPGREADVRLIAPDEVLVKGHGALLASALRNLLDNALKFTRAGNRVEVRVSVGGGHARLAVDDQGEGVPEAERERIFDPFFSGTSGSGARSGFGLGLPILRRVARAHGGDVEMSRSDLGGARFVLVLPTPPGHVAG